MDSLAGFCAHQAQGIAYLEEGDYQETIHAAGAGGDRRLQQ